jgi:hypothetical protein
MQSRSEECCDRAAECSQIAKRHSGLIKQQYEQIADQWLYLAEHTLILGTRCSFAPHRIRALRAARFAVSCYRQPTHADRRTFDAKYELPRIGAAKYASPIWPSSSPISFPVTHVTG